MIMDYINLGRRILIKKSNSPIQLTHFVTAKCNLRCKHCFYWKSIENSKNELTLEEIRKISKNMGGIFFLLISGGEPFLRDDLVEIVKTYYSNNKIKNLSIPTNGILDNKIIKMCKKILDQCPGLSFSLNLSLDGLREKHDKIRGKGTFNKAIRFYNKTKELKKDYEKFNISILTTINSINQKKLKEFHYFVKNELKPDMFTINLIRGKSKKSTLSKVDVKYYNKICDIINSQNDNKEKSLIKNVFNFNRFKKIIKYRAGKIRTDMILKTVNKNISQMPCYAAILDVVMYENGDVYPCELLDMKIGNVKDFDYNFKKLWDSKKAEDIRKFIKKSKCFCTHECNMRTNILFNPKYTLQVLFKNE